MEGLPVDHPMTKQVGLMRKVDKRSPAKYVMPEIQLADTVKPDPAKEAQPSQAPRPARRISFPRETPCAGRNFLMILPNRLCITCHVKGDKGVDFGPDLTRIGDYPQRT